MYNISNVRSAIHSSASCLKYHHSNTVIYLSTYLMCIDLLQIVGKYLYYKWIHLLHDGNYCDDFIFNYPL